MARKKKKFYSNDDRHFYLRELLYNGNKDSRMLAHALVHEWLKIGTFTRWDLVLYVERVAVTCASFPRV